jgi:hypothetical protein
MTAKLTATSMRREEAESLLMLEWSERWHSVQVEKDGERGRIAIEGSTRGRLAKLVVVSDERFGPDLLRGRGKSIGGDLNVDDEDSKRNFNPLQSLHHCSVAYQSMRHELTSPRRLIPASAIENTSKNEEDII